MESTVNIDGKMMAGSEATVSVFDHGYLYGDGVFEGMRVYSGEVFRLRAHMIRLYDSAKVLMLEIPWSMEEMERQVLTTVKESGLDEAYIRLVVSRGQGTLGIDPTRCPKAKIVIIVGKIQLYPEEYYQMGVPVITAATRRPSPDVLETRVKSLNYLNNILAKIEAKNAGALEAVMLNQAGYVVECSADNIFIIKNDRLLTPDPAKGALDGITRGVILELAENLGISWVATDLTRFDLYTSQECFITGSGAEIVPVRMIDGRIIGSGEPGPVTEKLRGAFREMIHKVPVKQA